MMLSVSILKKIAKVYGESFYLLDSKQFKTNYLELIKAFKKHYSNSCIAYSYKTNYIPKLCKINNQLGGFAEVVSDMEYELADRIGVDPQKIYFNGPYKNPGAIKKLLLAGGTVNIDSMADLEIIRTIAKENLDTKLGIGIRCNFDIYDGVVSRFGFDVDGNDFIAAIKIIRQVENIILKGLHCHFSTRSLVSWSKRFAGIEKIIKTYFLDFPFSFISFGGGLFGKMEVFLRGQFKVEIPSYKNYADEVAKPFSNLFKQMHESKRPILIIEPGTALVGDVMKFASQIFSIKDVKGKKIATLHGSVYNINPTLNKINLPITVFHDTENKNSQRNYSNLDFGGFTCIESDYLFRGYNGDLAVGDYVVFGNVGSYSIVLKPPFILPNFAIVELSSQNDEIELIRHRETFDDLFKNFVF